MKRPKKRDSSADGQTEFIAAWFPVSLVALLDRAVRATDTDRSKFLRAAVRDKVRGAIAK